MPSEVPEQSSSETVRSSTAASTIEPEPASSATKRRRTWLVIVMKSAIRKE